MQLFKKKAYTTANVEPLTITLVDTCLPTPSVNGAIVLGTGLEPYFGSPTFFATEAAALANTNWTPNLLTLGGGVTPPATVWWAAKDSEGTIVTKSTYVDCLAPTSCTCYTITNVGYVDGPGEEPALQGTNVTYRDCNGDPAMEVLPLVGNSVTICAETDSVVTLGDPATVEVSLTNCCDPWDPNTAQRSQVFVGQNSFSNPTSCCSDVTQTLYLATRNQNVMSVGDVLFTTLSGTTRFTGGGEFPNNYFKFIGMSLLNNAECFPLDCPTCSEVITVDSLGVITGKTCCS